jgi:hypothetical protein
VLKVKKCYPDGCTYFRWKCEKLNKGKSCIKHYKHVGRSCFSCRFFYDEKEINRPELLLTDATYKKFLIEFEEFEDWIAGLSGKHVEFTGTISAVKPQYYIRKNGNKYKVIHDGFVLTLHNCSLNYIGFNDSIYLPYSAGFQAKYHFAQGDSMSGSGYFSVKDGRIIVKHLRGIEILDKKNSVAWTDSDAKIAQYSGAILPYQSAKCYCCDKGLLLQVHSSQNIVLKPSRLMYCIEGVADPALCWYTLSKRVALSGCPNDGLWYNNIEPTDAQQ